MKAIWNERVVAESDDIVVVEGNPYFPRAALVEECFTASDHHTSCPWKGTADYLNVVVDGKVNANAAWLYPSTKSEAKNIEGRVAFWKGVEVS